ncbi:MAG: acyl-CoA dehydrogenase family protein, partial [Spirochaetota bacterium]
MNFNLTEEQRLLRKLYKEFTVNEVEPIAGEIDEEGRFPVETVEKMKKNGMLGIPFPKKYGGQGGDNQAYIMLVEELSKACGTTGVVVSAHTSLCCAPIYEFGTEEQKQKYLVPLAKGEKLGA